MSAPGVVVRGPIRSGYDSVLTSDALQFLAELHRKFEKGRRGILADREQRQIELDKGKFPTFLNETEHVRKGDWKGAKVVKDLEDRRVEITGPVDRKMIINALNSGAKVFMADFEDSTAPTWDNLISGHINLRDAIERTITFEQSGKHYELQKDKPLATLMVRPRGWHLPEAHILVDGDVISGSLFDFGLYFYHNAKRLITKGSGPYFYLPKMEGHKEARLWNDVFLYSQKRIGIPSGTIRATVLIETILAAFEMDEILYELREHSAGLNCLKEDHQLLTNRGFLGITEVEKYAALSAEEQQKGPLLFATFDPVMKELVYQEASRFIINSKAEKPMVELTMVNESYRWKADSDKYGRTPDQVGNAAALSARCLANPLEVEERDTEDCDDDNDSVAGSVSSLPSNFVSVIVTADHDLFGLRGTQVNGHRRITWPKTTARGPDGKPLLTGKGNIIHINRSPEKFPAGDAISSSEKACLKLFAAAPAGVRQNCTELPFVKCLGLSDHQVSPFLEFYGYWLGDGSLSFPDHEVVRFPDSVHCTIVKPHDKAWLIQTAVAMGLKKGTDWRESNNTNTWGIHIVKSSWCQYFADEYGRKYSTYRARTSSAESSSSTPPLSPMQEDVKQDVQIEHNQPIYNNEGVDLPYNIKSAKWFWWWVFKRCTRDQLRLIIAGLRRADGKEAHNKNVIITSSTVFRDQLVQVCLHAGYSAYFKLECTAGTCHAWMWGKPVITKNDAWSVMYRDSDHWTQPVIHQKRDVKQTDKYEGRTWCVTVPNGLLFTRRASVDDTGITTKASVPIIIGNCGRWDYIFSFIKKFRLHKQFVTPDRAQVTMTTPFMANYVRLLIQTCHKRGVHAMGGMAAQIPINNNPTANQTVLDKVKADKLREVTQGCDGTWVAHPGLMSTALTVFNQHMTTPNQIHKPIERATFTEKDLLDLGPKGTITRSGLLANIDIGLHYTESWLRGLGCVPLHNLMEDAATAEISRCQLWQWIKHGAATVEGDVVTKDYVKRALTEIVQEQKAALGEEVFNQKRKFNLAQQLFEQMVLNDRLDDFLTLVAYPYITSIQDKKGPQIKSKL